MERACKLFLKIADKMIIEHSTVELGKMMSSPALRYKNKVFAFYHNKEMIFRLGKEFEPEVFRLKKYSVLNPFKNRAPMYGWIEVPYVENKKWEKLAGYALNRLVKDSR